MIADRWKRIEEIYHAVRERSPEDRAAYLQEACGDDADLHDQVASILAHAEVLSKLESGAPPATAALTLAPETMVGPYRIEEQLDSGGMGAVYRALDTRLGRQVAIKVGFAQFSDRFHREARMIAALNHSNVCTLHDIGSTSEVPGFLVMEFVEGSTLADLLQKGPLPIREALQIARQIASALAAAHERGIVHRDLKPANVKITPQGVVKVLDFGLAKGFPGSAVELTRGTITAQGAIIGTASYMSPEQAAGKEFDARSDIFSFGTVLYEMLSGRRPFTGATATNVIAAILKDAPEPLRKGRSGIPERLERIVAKCLRKAPEDRYGSALDLRHDLESVIQALEPKHGLSYRSAITAAALIIAVVGGVFAWRFFQRQYELRWLEQTAVPEITRLLQQERPLAALKLYREAQRIAPDSILLYKLAEGVASNPIQFETSPPGATIYVSDYTAAAGDDLSQWELAGVAPVTLSEVPRWGYYRLRAVKNGFSTVDEVFSGLRAERTISVTLKEESGVPPGMVWAPDSPATATHPQLPGFWIDRFEVTNRQFQEFVSAGGYSKKEYWKEPFLKDGRPVTWEAAMIEFRDLTGRSGPAGWSLGAYPEGSADHPVAGVSWYEAAAYAEYAGKALPTVHEWRYVAPVEGNSSIVLMSNFSGKAPASVGAYSGMAGFGAYDMAGNVKEWTMNATGSLRYAYGGAWDEPAYNFQLPDARDPFTRTISFGFRCVKRPIEPPASVFAPVQYRPPGNVRTQKPVGEETYRAYVDLHRYERSALDARVERTDDASPYWTQERVSYSAAYGKDERVIAHLFLPKNAAPPYQVIAVFGGSTVMDLERRIEEFSYPYEFLIRSGRAVIIPAYAGTLERGPSALFLPVNEEIDRSRKWSWDLGRSVDYLETRADIDASKLGFYGVSWGAGHAPRLLAVDTRFRAAALLSGGFIHVQPPEVDSWNFASRYTLPTLMINGKQDFITPSETNQKLFFGALGTNAANKKFVQHDGGHSNPVTRPNLLGEIIAWFDHYLGPVQERPAP
jgi:dienelactone hydrolase